MPSIFRGPGPAPFLLIAWTLWLAAIAMGEQVPANDGLGWDGVRFARYATDGPQALFNREINSYYVQRVGPSLLVHGLIRSSGLPFDAVTIRWSFLALNLILLSGAILMLSDIARRMELSTRAHWLLFVGLMVTAANARMPVYYANIGDSMAFTLGMTMLWGWVTRRLWVLAVAALVALVSWPAAFYLLVPLILWPRGAEPEVRIEREAAAVSLHWGWIAGALPMGAALLTASWLVSTMPAVPGWTPWTTASLASNAWIFGMAAVAALAQINLGLWKEATSGVSLKAIAVAVVLGLCGRAYVAATQSGSLAFSEVIYWREVLLYVRTRPLAPLVGHAAYFGALAVIAAAVWPKALAAGRRLGPGPFVALALIGLQALDTESRRLSANWPLVGLCVVLAIEPWLSDIRVMATAICSGLLFSKLWWRWSGPSLFAERYEPGNYYNLQGPSLSDEAYVVHLVAMATLATVVWLVVQRSPNLSARSHAISS